MLKMALKPPPVLKRTICIMGCEEPAMPLFMFPKNSRRMKQWLELIEKTIYLTNYNEGYIYSLGRICAKHFRADAFTSTLKTKLIRFAAPIDIRSSSIQTDISLSNAPEANIMTISSAPDKSFDPVLMSTYSSPKEGLCSLFRPETVHMKDVDCFQQENQTDLHEHVEQLLTNEETNVSCAGSINSLGTPRTPSNWSSLSLESFSAEDITGTYSEVEEEEKNENLISDQELLFIDESFTFQHLQKNLSLIKKPNNCWGISSHSSVIICARWTEDFTCRKRVVIENSLVVRVFLDEWEITLSDLMNITCVEDLSNLLEKVESCIKCNTVH